MILQKHIYATAGLYYVYSSDIAFVSVERVTLEGSAHNITTDIADSLKVKYSPAEGKIYFLNAFVGGEKVSIIYKK